MQVGQHSLTASGIDKKWCSVTDKDEDVISGLSLFLRHMKNISDNVYSIFIVELLCVDF